METLSFDAQAIVTAVDFDPFAGGELVLTAPATASQTEIWAAVQMGDAANCAYNESQSLLFAGKLDVLALQTALQQLVNRHEALRTTFSTNGQTLCIVATRQLETPLIDLTDLAPSEQGASLARIVARAVQQPFDLEHGPLFRSQIVKFSEIEHRALLTTHHIICDGWSWGVLMSDLGRLYSAFQAGTDAKFDRADAFSEYAISQIEAAQSEEAIETESYWLAQFADNIPIVDFPTDRSRPPLRTYDADRIDWDLQSELVTGLKQLGTELGCSFMTIFLAGFEVWLQRLTGQQDLIIGIPAAGQSAVGQAQLVGHCVNLLPLRTQIDPAKSFRDYVGVRKLSILDAYDRQQFTFGSLLSKLALPRDSSRIPLVPIVFNLDRGLAAEDLMFGDLTVEFYTNPRAFENFELFINATELAGKITLECQYNTNLFDAETIRQRLAELATLLSAVVTDPDLIIARLPILPEVEQQSIATWNDTQTAYDRVRCIHQLFEERAQQHPDAVAVVFEAQQLTYRQLNQTANQIAHYLQRLGVGPDVLVGICCERSIEMVVGLMAILKAGGAYVPFDPSDPPARLSYLLNDAGVKVLLTQSKLVSALPTHSALTICLDTELPEIDRFNQENPAPELSLANLAYVLYTSGSTGQPKGVMNTHQGILNRLLWMQEVYQLTSSDRVLQKTPFSFDVSVWEFFWPLLAGATLVVAKPEGHKDSNYLVSLIAQQQITTLHFVPSMLQFFLQEPGLENCHCLQRVFCSGEALPVELTKRFFQHLHCELHNLYGPTEAAIDVTFWQCQPHEHLQRVPIGRPISNIQIHILDNYRQPVPIGVAGELYIGGDGLARGYLNCPELTQERFIVNPLSATRSARLYQTGDRARYRRDGNIEYLGRLDRQIKLRGFRIELGEIEALLDRYPTVEWATVVMREDSPGDRRLVAYCVSADPQLKISQLRQFIAAQVPNYMVPSIFVLLDAMPLTANGKIDIQALPLPDDTRPDLAAIYTAPRTPIERQIADIWMQVLKLDRVGIHDNFFELGGYSLVGIQTIARLRQALQVEIPISTLFELPTVAALADRVETLLWAAQGAQIALDDSSDDYEEGEL